MKLTLILATLTLTAPLAHAETFGFVNLQRVSSESTEAKRLQSEATVDRDTKQREVDAALEAVKRARVKCSPLHVTDGKTNLDPPCKPAEALQRKAEMLGKTAQAELTKRQQDAAATWNTHLQAAVAAVQRERHVTVLAMEPVVPDPKRDVTNDVIKRLNVADATAPTASLSRLKAQLVEARAAQAKLAAQVSALEAARTPGHR